MVTVTADSFRLPNNYRKTVRVCISFITNIAGTKLMLHYPSQSDKTVGALWSKSMQSKHCGEVVHLSLPFLQDVLPMVHNIDQHFT